jgi:hypothetical protein
MWFPASTPNLPKEPVDTFVNSALAEAWNKKPFKNMEDGDHITCLHYIYIYEIAIAGVDDLPLIPKSSRNENTEAVQDAGWLPPFFISIMFILMMISIDDLVSLKSPEFHHL